MTTFWKLIILSISLLFALPSKSQEILRTETGDTLVTITPRQLNIINCIISDYEFSLQKERILKQKICVLEDLNSRTDSLRRISEEEIKVRDEYWRYRVVDLEKQVKKEVRKRNVIGGVGGAIIVTLLTLLVFR